MHPTMNLHTLNLDKPMVFTSMSISELKDKYKVSWDKLWTMFDQMTDDEWTDRHGKVIRPIKGFGTKIKMLYPNQVELLTRKYG